MKKLLLLAILATSCVTPTPEKYVSDLELGPKNARVTCDGGYHGYVDGDHGIIHVAAEPMGNGTKYTITPCDHSDE